MEFMNFVYNNCEYIEVGLESSIYKYKSKEDTHMFFFNKEKKKKKYTALKVVAIIVGILALIAGGYVLYTKVIKPKLEAKKAAALDAVEPECEIECEELAVEAAE